MFSSGFIQLGPQQPNGPKNHQQQAKDADEEGIAKEDTIVLIPMDTLLREIKRLAAHEFGGPWKAAPYPVELEVSRCLSLPYSVRPQTGFIRRTINTINAALVILIGWTQFLA